jgi:hypothetical protein
MGSLTSAVGGLQGSPRIRQKQRITMKKIATLALTAAAAVALAACGQSDQANEAAEADNVEMPAEEAVNALDEAVVPVPDTGTTGAATDAAAPAGAATDPTAKAVEDATLDAEKKM